MIATHNRVLRRQTDYPMWLSSFITSSSPSFVMVYWSLVVIGAAQTREVSSALMTFNFPAASVSAGLKVLCAIYVWLCVSDIGNGEIAPKLRFSF